MDRVLTEKTAYTSALVKLKGRRFCILYTTTWRWSALERSQRSNQPLAASDISLGAYANVVTILGSNPASSYTVRGCR
jgi:hypothetical protein